MPAEHRTNNHNLRDGTHFDRQSDIAREALTDITAREDIECFVTEFYSKLLNDPQLAPIFIEVAKIELSVQLPMIIDYWEKLLLGGRKYQRHTMNIHRKVHSDRPLNAKDFELWLQHFETSMNHQHIVPIANRAKRVSARIAQNMLLSL